MVNSLHGITFRNPRPPLVAPGECDLHQRDMTATFSVVLTLADVQTRLSAIGQWLPIDGAPEARIADLVDGDSTGPLRLGYGAWRDLLLGLQFHNGAGELITAGGRTVKNVAGYDLTKFMVGQSGVFGKLATITTRTYRRPDGAIVASYPADPGIVSRLMPTPCRPQWAMMSGGELLLGYVGDGRTLDYYAEQLKQAGTPQIVRRTIEEDIADRARRWNAEGELVFRASVPPARIQEFARLAGLQAGDRWVADAAFGVVIGSAPPATSARLREAASRLDGTVRFRRGSIIGPLLDVSTNPVERQIIERLKKAYDPDNQLNPLPWH